MLARTALTLRRLVVAAAVLGATARAGAAHKADLFPWTEYDPAVPAPSEALGYALGEHHTTYGPMSRYLAELARRSARVRLETFGASWEKRSLYVAVVTAPENHERLDAIRSGLDRLARVEPMTSAEVESVFATTPAVALLLYGNDGNETAAFEAAIHLVYELAAARGPAIERLLERLVVLVVPAVNPDSHERYVAWYNAFHGGLAGAADPAAAEHHPPWGVSTNNNHYQINLNRDSVWGTQPETRALVALYRRWNPQLVVDHHGETDAFVGPWMVEPIHAVVTERQRTWWRRYGEALAAAFAERRYRYTPWEFGQFDPGYWDTLPNFTGAIGFTVETTGGGYRGLRYETKAGLLYTLADGARQHLLADRVVLELLAERREEALRDWAAYKASAAAPAERLPVEAVAFPPENDPARLGAVVDILLRDGIALRRAAEPFAVARAEPYLSGDPGRRQFPAGTILVPLRQPEGRLARVLLEPRARMSDAFLAYVAEHRRRRARPGFFHPDIWTTHDAFYDVTAWSLPLTYDLEAYELAAMPDVETEDVEEGPVLPKGRFEGAEAPHALVLDWTSNHAVRAVARLRADGVRVRVATEPFVVGGRDFGRGAIAVFAAENEGRDLGELGTALAEEGLDVLGVDGNLVEEGPHLGSDKYVAVAPTAIAVAMGAPVRPSSYGSVWFLFERRYGIPFTPIHVDRLAEVALERYGVLVLPDGDFGGLDAARAAALSFRLREWVERGGTLVALRGASAWVAREDSPLTRIRIRGAGTKSLYMTEGSPPAGTGELAAPETGRVETVPGAILRATADPVHFLSFGYEGELPVFVWSSLAFVDDSSLGAPIRFADRDRLLLSGYADGSSLDRLAGTPYLMEERVGAGHVVLFLDDPNFRLFWDGLTRLFMNAVFFAPSF